MAEFIKEERFIIDRAFPFFVYLPKNPPALGPPSWALVDLVSAPRMDHETPAMFQTN